MSNSSPTFRLFRKLPNFMDGFASSMDFFGNEALDYKISATEKEADMASIYSDWQAVGNDMKKAIKDEHDATKRRS